MNEAYLRLAQHPEMRIADRHHYLVVAARAMRRVLVDSARRRSSLKRAAGERVDLDRAGLIHSGHLEEYLIIDRALTELAAIDGRQAEIVELRFFAGLSVEETAKALEISEKTVKRDWAMARAWLRGELTQGART